ncbi:hypothetical protein G6045_13790 [Streptomyces sp. YC504]|uniref:Uncharacterized protein n=1 Tax=Streptomyces mesophilus TaxID=1775132 RepID=A0A6G4XJC5_9ACTN|nr:hypothetical protein [Streptomyces mesophilus]NGO76731.1 hypothetical protein [Streptomyces mesophilus]
MIPEAHLYLHHQNTAQLPATTEPFTPPRTPARLRVQLGWTLVHVGLRLATPGRPAPALSS